MPGVLLSLKQLPLMVQKSSHHHLTCLKACKWWDILTNYLPIYQLVSRISSINRMDCAILAKALITTAEPRGKQGQPAPEGFLGWTKTPSFWAVQTGVVKLPILRGSNNPNVWWFWGISPLIVHCLGWTFNDCQNVNFRQVLVDNKWPNKSSVFFLVGKNCFIRSEVQLLASIWQSCHRLFEPARTRIFWKIHEEPPVATGHSEVTWCYPQLVPVTDKTLWLGVHHMLQQLGGPSCSTSGLSNKRDGTEYIFFVLSSNSDEVCANIRLNFFEVSKFFRKKKLATM